MKNIFITLLLLSASFAVKAQDNNTIRTNATCKAGQDRITNELKKLDGVFEVKFSTDGTITLDYSSDGTPYNDIVEKLPNVVSLQMELRQKMVKKIYAKQ
jgi:copper chaperone CopZ